MSVTGHQDRTTLKIIASAVFVDLVSHGPARSVAIIVAEREPGTVLGWDGFYNDVGNQFPKVTSLADLNWDEWG